MRKLDFKAMQFDELWEIHEELTKVLADRIMAEKRELEARLAQLSRVEIIRGAGALDLSATSGGAMRRKYPKVLPKYRNPLSPLETWSGRGKQPRWLVAALKSGHNLDEFKIATVEEKPAKKVPVRHRHS
jgi:DNA-binding protein H-NS